jgi:serine/threonine-protein kinase
MGTATTKAANGYATLHGLNYDGTPFVWDGKKSLNYRDPGWLTKLLG